MESAAMPESRPTFPCPINLFKTLAFVGAYLFFGFVGSAVSLACIIPAIFFRGERAQSFGQRLIHGLFVFFVSYLRWCGLLKLDARDLSSLRNSRGLIIVANHPSLLDAVLTISQFPQMVCLMKKSLTRNVVLCGTARLAGYIQNDAGVGMIKQCRQRLRQGSNVLIYPEGTRSIAGKIREFKMGFALIAKLEQVPVQTLIIKSESNFLGKGWPLLKKPFLPLSYSLTLGRRFVPTPDMDAKAFGADVENFFRRVLEQRVQSSSPSVP